MPETLAIIIPDDVDPAEIPTRGYDFAAGDRRFNDHQRAIDFAIARANDTGVRSTVRLDPSTPHFVKLWLVQALGS